MTGDLIQYPGQFHLVRLAEDADSLVDVFLEGSAVLQLLPPALGRQEDPGDTLVVEIHLPPDGACLLEPLKDARDPGTRQMQRIREVLLTHAFARREQSQADERAVMNARITQAPLHRLAVQVEHPSQSMKSLKSHLIDFAILRHRGSFLSVADAIFWAIVVCLGAARFLDVVKLRGHTASGEPASTAHLRRYLLFLPAASAILWGLAHAGAHFDVFTF